MIERERIKCGQCFGFYEHDVDCDGHPESPAALRSQLAAAQQENERLRMALDSIACSSPTRGTLTGAIITARAALASSPQGEKKNA